MTQDSFPSDPQNIWRSQKNEATVISRAELQNKILKIQAKRRTEVRFNFIVTLVITAIFITVSIRYVHEIYPLVGWLMVIGAMLYILGFILFDSMRDRRAERFDSNVGMYRSLQFYRRLLEQKRHRARHMAIAAIPLVIGGVLNTVPAILLTIQYPVGDVWIRLIPFFATLGGWLLLFGLVRRRFHREMRRELEMIEAMEREVPSAT